MDRGMGQRPKGPPTQIPPSPPRSSPRLTAPCMAFPLNIPAQANSTVHGSCPENNPTHLDPWTRRNDTAAHLFAIVGKYRCLCYGQNCIIWTKYGQTIDGWTKDIVPQKALRLF